MVSWVFIPVCLFAGTFIGWFLCALCVAGKDDDR